jgi:uncharacterized protein YndB with AHSA1/START domain
MATETAGGTGTLAAGPSSGRIETTQAKEEAVTALAHQLERTILIEAPPATVFRYFTDSDRRAAWWGQGSTIDPRPGGRVFVRYPDGTEATGEVVDVDPPSRITFTYGYLKNAPGPGESRVTITLERAGRHGTRLRLTHDFADPAHRDHHVQGWRYQLSLFANVVANEVHADPAARVDAWFAAWSERDEQAVDAALATIASPDVRVRDRFSCLAGAADVTEHIRAWQRFMPGMRLTREGDVQHCQGQVLANWIATGPDGKERGRGTNVFAFDADGRIDSVTGFWRQA